MTDSLSIRTMAISRSRTGKASAMASGMGYGKVCQGTRICYNIINGTIIFDIYLVMSNLLLPPPKLPI